MEQATIPAIAELSNSHWVCQLIGKKNEMLSSLNGPGQLKYQSPSINYP